MSLRNQLFIVLSAIFGVVLISILWVALNGTRHYLETQLASHAQETATTLSMSLGQSLGSGDRALAITQVRSIFDRGDFKRIEVLSIDRKSMTMYELPEKVQGVPLWFVKAFRIDAPAGESFVGSGWKQLGKVIVISQPTFAYQHLWRTTMQFTAWLIGLWALTLGLIQVVLHFVLTPLRAIERSARSVQSKQFEQISMRPRAPELARVVIAMNDMSRRVGDMLEAEARKVAALHRLSYEDDATGLANRHGLELHLTELLQGDQPFGVGAAIALELDDMRLFNRSQGFNAGRAILQMIAEQSKDQLKVQKGCFLARANEFSFVFLLLAISESEANREASELHRRLVERLSVLAPGQAIRLHLGLAFFQIGDTRTDVFARTDLAVEGARQRGVHGFKVLENSPDPRNSLGSFGWRTLIQSALSEGRLQLILQPVISLNEFSQRIHLEAYARLTEADGNSILASKFLPMAARHQLLPLVDREMFKLVASRIKDPSFTGDSFAMNISPQSLADSAFMVWFSSALSELGQNAARFAIEVSEFGALRDKEAVRKLKALAHVRGCRFGYDNFGLGPDGIALLREVPADYVKLSGALVTEIVGTTTASELLLTFVKLAHGLDISVVALCVESAEQKSALIAAGVDAGQGYLFGAPA